MSQSIIRKSVFLLGIVVAIVCCSNKEDATPFTTSNIVTDVCKKIYGASSVTSDGTFITI